MDNVNVKNTLLHEIYKKVDREFNDILSNYRINNYKMLKDIINNNPSPPSTSWVRGPLPLGKGKRALAGGD